MSFSRNLKSKALKVWEEGYNHPFVQELGKGTLDRDKFKFYLLQDHCYLLQYAKVFAAGALKAESEDLMERFSTALHSTLSNEMNMHRAYMADFGITPEETRSAKPSLYNRTYTANMLAISQTGGIAEIIAAVFPCAWTYADYGKRLKKQYAEKLDANFYKSWIENYASDDFSASFEWFYDTLDGFAAYMPGAQKEKIEEIFISSVEFEYLFWDMAYNRRMSY